VKSTFHIVDTRRPQPRQNRAGLVLPDGPGAASEAVVINFERYGLLDEWVRFLIDVRDPGGRHALCSPVSSKEPLQEVARVLGFDQAGDAGDGGKQVHLLVLSGLRELAFLPVHADCAAGGDCAYQSAALSAHPAGTPDRARSRQAGGGGCSQ
jgi:hypothetical protein